MRKPVAIVVAVAVIGVGVWSLTKSDPEAMYAELVAELRARGEPLTVADAEPPMPSDAENGALDLELARRWWRANQPDEGWDADIAGAWNSTVRAPWWENSSPEQLERLPEFLVHLRPLFEHVDRGTRKPEIAWPYRAPQSAAAWVDDPVPGEIRWLQELPQYLEARAIAGATAAERCAGIRSGLAIGARYRGRLGLGQVVSRLTFHRATLDLRRGLEGGTLDPLQARPELDALLDTPFRSRLSALVQRERAHMLELVPMWIDGSMERELEVRRTRVRTPSLFDQLEDWVDDKHPDAEAYLAWIRQLDVFVGLGDTPAELRDVGYPTARPFNGTQFLIQHLRQVWVDADAAARLGRVALASYAYRDEHGAWPENSDDLGSLFPDGVPLDPFTGEPFVVGRDGEHLTLRAQRWGFLERDAEEPRAVGDDWRLPPR